MGKQGPDVVNKLGAGRFEFHGPWGVSVSSNLTSKGLKNKSDVAIKNYYNRHTVKWIVNDAPMGCPYYANIKADDLDTIVIYLGTLPLK